MEHITSLKNPKVAAWKALKDRKGRRESGCFLVEGRKMVEEALKSAFDVEAVLVQEGVSFPDGLTMPVTSCRRMCWRRSATPKRRRASPPSCG